MNAFAYLVWTSARNRLVHALRRAKSPRYAAALIIGALYVWSFLFRPASHLGAASFLLGQPTEAIVTLLVALTLMSSWVFGADATALAFTQAEVSMLFPAPLSRRSLIKYKLFRAQIAVLINALIWVFVLRRGGTLLPPPLRAAGLWVLFSTLSLHRLGAALVRSSWREHGRSGTRRHIGSIVVFGAVGVSIVLSLIESRQDLLRAEGFGAFFTVLGHALARPPALWGLFPFHLVVAPSFARSSGAWLHALGPAVVVMLVHAWWVLRADTAFEDAAIDASADRARRLLARSRRAFSSPDAPRAANSTIALASVGRPAMAIVWKNMLCLRRTAQLRVFIGPMGMALAIGAAMADGRGDWTEVFAVCSVAFAATLLLFGSRLIRNDLRQDMQHLPLLKTLPVPPADIVLAEVASAAIPMAVVQMIFLIAAYAVLLLSPASPVGAGTRLALLIASPFVVMALNAALLTIQNGTAVLFPTWIRLGPSVNTGVEALGQNVLATAASLISLAIGLILPGLAGWGVLALVGARRPLGLAAGAIIASLILGAETHAAISILGKALAKTEPTETE